MCCSTTPTARWIAQSRRKHLSGAAAPPQAARCNCWFQRASAGFMSRPAFPCRLDRYPDVLVQLNWVIHIESEGQRPLQRVAREWPASAFPARDVTPLLRQSVQENLNPRRLPLAGPVPVHDCATAFIPGAYRS